MEETAKVPADTPAWEAIDIYVFTNGQKNSPPRKYHLLDEDLSSWNSTLKYLGKSQYGSESIIDLYTIEGNKVAGPLELSNGTFYVAVEPLNAFIDAGYERYLIKASRSWEKRQAKRNDLEKVSDESENENQEREQNKEQLEEHKMKSEKESLLLNTIKSSVDENESSLIITPQPEPALQPKTKSNTTAKPVQRKRISTQRSTLIGKTSPCLPNQRQVSNIKPPFKKRDGLKSTNVMISKPENERGNKSARLPIKSKNLKQIYKPKEPPIPEKIKVSNNYYNDQSNLVKTSETSDAVNDKEVEGVSNIHNYKNTGKKSRIVTIDSCALNYTQDLKPIISQVYHDNTQNINTDNTKNEHEVDENLEVKFKPKNDITESYINKSSNSASDENIITEINSHRVDAPMVSILTSNKSSNPCDSLRPSNPKQFESNKNLTNTNTEYTNNIIVVDELSTTNIPVLLNKELSCPHRSHTDIILKDNNTNQLYNYTLEEQNEAKHRSEEKYPFNNNNAHIIPLTPQHDSEYHKLKAYERTDTQGLLAMNLRTHDTSSIVYTSVTGHNQKGLNSNDNEYVTTNKGDTVNLKISIEIKIDDNWSKNNDNLELKSVTKEKASQTDLVSTDIVGHETLVSLIVEKVEHHLEEKLNFLFVQCNGSHCKKENAALVIRLPSKPDVKPSNRETSEIRLSKSDPKDERFSISDPFKEIHASSSLEKLITVSGVKHPSETMPQINDETIFKDGNILDKIKPDRVVPMEQSAVVSDTSKLHNDNGITENVSANIPKVIKDSFTQTDWCNLLLEVKLESDGHYTFCLPSLGTLKYFKLL